MDIFSPGTAGHGSALVLDGGPRCVLHGSFGLRSGVRSGAAAQFTKKRVSNGRNGRGVFAVPGTG